MKVLAIGNSFSTDATRYVHEIAKADNFDLTVMNLFIGSCSLDKHLRNLLGDSKTYSLEFNGYTTGFMVSIKEALLSNEWDYITLQQMSAYSVDYSTYQPYLNRLVAYIKEFAPKAKIILHQTWTYEEDSFLLHNLGYDHEAGMFKDLERAYLLAEKDISADGMILSGELLQKLKASGIKKVHRDDTLHASFGIGRYAVGLLWYACLSGNDITDNSFSYFDADIPEEEIKIAKQCVKEILEKKI